jgi:hypothetical protein
MRYSFPRKFILVRMFMLVEALIVLDRPKLSRKARFESFFADWAIGPNRLSRRE